MWLDDCVDKSGCCAGTVVCLRETVMHASLHFEDLDPHFLNVKQNKLSQFVMANSITQRNTEQHMWGSRALRELSFSDDFETKEKKASVLISGLLPIPLLVPLGLKRICLRTKGVGGDVVCVSAFVLAYLSVCVCVCVSTQ